MNPFAEDAEQARKWVADSVLKLLFESPVPLSAEDIQRDSGFDRLNVTVAIADLSARNLVRTLRHAGTNTPLYEASAAGSDAYYGQALAGNGLPEGPSATMGKAPTSELTRSTAEREKRAGVALLVGAGASVPFKLPTMVAFIGHLKERIGQELSAEPRAGIQLLKRIIDLPSSEPPDLERVMEVLYALTQLADAAIVSLYPTMQPVGHSMMHLNTSAIAGHAERALTFLRDEIWRVYSVSLKGFDVEAVHGCLLAELKLRQLKGVFTTNYDMVLDDLFYQQNAPEICNGFGEDGKGNWAGFRGGLIPYCKLHGSLDWHRDSATGRVAATGVPLRSSGDRSTEVILYPFRKSFISFQPFFALFDKFWATLRAVQTLVVLGYALRDELVSDPIIAESRDEYSPLTILLADKSTAPIRRRLVERGVPESSIASVDVEWGAGTSCAQVLDCLVKTIGRKGDWRKGDNPRITGGN